MKLYDFLLYGVVELNRFCTIIVCTCTDTHVVRKCQGIYKARQIPYKTLYKGLKLESSSPVQYSIPAVHSTVCTLPLRGAIKYQQTLQRMTILVATIHLYSINFLNLSFTLCVGIGNIYKYDKHIITI